MSEELITQRLRSSRELADLTQEEVGSKVGRSKSYISRLESGDNLPTVWLLLIELAQVYDTSADYLLGLTESPLPPENRKLSTIHRELWEIYVDLPRFYQRTLLLIARSFQNAGSLIETERLEMQELLLDYVEDYFGKEIADEVLQGLLSSRGNPQGE